MAPSAVDPTSRTPPATCPRCGADIDMETDVCPQCGGTLEAPQAPGEPVPGQVVDGKFRILAQRAAVEQEPSRIGVAVSVGASARSPWGGSLRTASVEGDTGGGPTARPLRRRRRILGAPL